MGKVTHLNLDDDVRRLAAMRAAQQGMSLTDYISTLISRDAEQAGLAGYLQGTVQLGEEACDD